MIPAWLVVAALLCGAIGEWIHLIDEDQERDD